MHGIITVGTKINNKDFAKQLAQLEKQAENKKIDIELTTKDLSREEDNLKQLTNEADRLDAKYYEINQKIKEQKDLIDSITTKQGSTVIIPREVHDAYIKANQEIDFLRGKQDSLLSQIEKNNEAIGKQEPIVSRLNAKYEKQINDLNLINNKLEEQKHKGFAFITSSIKNVGSSIEGVVKKVAKWGIAVFGLRSAYSFITREMSTLSGYNKQIGSDVEYMRFAIASSLQPVIEGIIKLAQKLLAYVAYIANAWFGVNIFANASSKAFEKANKNVKATNKSAKELQKTIAGFDEMNILQKNGDVGSGGGGGGVKAAEMPSFDLSQWEQIEKPGWIKWIAENGDAIKTILIEIGLAIAGIKIAEFINWLGILSTKLTGFKTFLMGLGIALIIYGVYELIKNIIEAFKDPSWENIKGAITGLITVLMGLAVALLAVNAANPVGWIMMAIAAVAMLITAIADLIAKYFKETTQAELLERQERSLKDAKEKLKNVTNDYVYAVDNAESAEKKLNDVLKKHKISADELNKIVELGTEDYSKLTPKQKEVYKAYLDNKNAQEQLKKTSKDLRDAQHEETQESIILHRYNAEKTEDYVKLGKEISNAFGKQKISLEDAVSQTIWAMGSMDDETKKYFVQTLPQEILQAIDTGKYTYGMKKFNDWWNKNMTNLNSTITVKVSYQTSGSSSKNFAKGGIAYYSGVKLPRLASGGIINQPGRGVPLASAIGGEKRAEGVIPLTDSQQMALLGEAIGKYITINANIVNSMNGRVISREIQKINNESDFAFNN